MRGIAKQRKMAAKLGQAWCDKGFHFTAVESGQYVTYGGRFGFGDEEWPWPKPCRTCVEMYEEEDSSTFASDDEVRAIAKRQAERWRGTLEILARY